MAGDWIKMRGNLWDDPRVGRIADITDTTEATVIGGLYWLWASADQHTENGVMPGLSIRRIDSKTGIKGFGDALVSIGWLSDHPDGVSILKFEEHNGSSAKKRCQTAKRVAAFKAGNADETNNDEEGNAPSVTGSLPVRDLEKELEEEESSSVAKATGGTPPKAAKPDVDPEKAQIWSDLKTSLVDQETCKTTKDAGVLLGKVASKYGKDVFFEASRETLRDARVNTHTYLIELCERAAGKRTPLNTNKQTALEDRNRAVADAWVPPELRNQPQEVI